MGTSVKIILDNRRKKVDGSYPIKLRITHDRIRKYYPCNYDMLEEDFKKLSLPKLDKSQKSIKKQFTVIEVKAEEIISKMSHFTFEQFEILYFSNHVSTSNVFDLFDSVILRMRQEDRIGTAHSYENAAGSLRRFKSDLKFGDITPQFLAHFEKKMIEDGATYSTIGFYLRALRRIYNIAISKSLARREDYPFGMDRYRIPIGSNVKKALTLEEVQLIFDYKCIPSSPMQRAKDFWILTYLCSGINMTDIAHLKFKDISDGEIHFVRQKTIRSAKKKLVNVTLLPETKAIIDRWKNIKYSPNDYVFPILLPGTDAASQKEASNNFLKSVNKFMKRIAADLKIDKNITTYVARHSFATILKRSGASTEFIQEQLAHADKSTTENYLSSFEKEERMKTTLALTRFKKD